MRFYLRRRSALRTFYLITLMPSHLVEFCHSLTKYQGWDALMVCELKIQKLYNISSYLGHYITYKNECDGFPFWMFLSLQKYLLAVKPSSWSCCRWQSGHVLCSIVRFNFKSSVATVNLELLICVMSGCCIILGVSVNSSWALRQPSANIILLVVIFRLVINLFDY